jgi:diaminopropionate ammonia-lyase
LLVKDESTRLGLQAFKGLGASYAVDRYIGKYGKPGAFYTATDGNHGRAVAWAARQVGVPAVVYMPKGTVAARVRAIADLGATVEVTNWNYDDTVNYSAKIAAQNNGALMQDTAWEGYEEIPRWIMEG